MTTDTKSHGLPTEIWVALTTERPEMIGLYLNNVRKNPELVDVEGLCEVIGAMAEECLDLRDRLRQVEKLITDVRGAASGLHTLGDKLLRESDFLHQREEEYDGDPEGRRSEGKRNYIRDREEARPTLSDARQRLEAAFLAHVSGEGLEAADAAVEGSEEPFVYAAGDRVRVHVIPETNPDGKGGHRERGLHHMIDTALAHFIPKSETDLREALERVKSNAGFKAPEHMSDCWTEAQDALMLLATPDKGPWVAKLAHFWDPQEDR